MKSKLIYATLRIPIHSTCPRLRETRTKLFIKLYFQKHANSVRCHLVSLSLSMLRFMNALLLLLSNECD